MKKLVKVAKFITTCSLVAMAVGCAKSETESMKGVQVDNRLYNSAARQVGEAVPATQAANVAGEVKQGEAPKLSSELQTQKGKYTFGQEVETFTPCGSSKSYWVEAPQSILNPLRTKAKQQGEYEPIDVELTYRHSTESSTSLAQIYDGVVKVEKAALAQGCN